ncbi:chemotaxis response regulator CheB [Paraburkholderia sp. WSM4175]
MHMTNVVQHHLPGESTQFVSLVRKWTSLPVCAAKNGERPEPAHVYVAS